MMMIKDGEKRENIDEGRRVDEEEEETVWMRRQRARAKEGKEVLHKKKPRM